MISQIPYQISSSSTKNTWVLLEWQKGDKPCCPRDGETCIPYRQGDADTRAPLNDPYVHWIPHLWSRELLQADLGYRNGFDEKIMHWIPNAKPQAETSCSNKRSHLCRFRCGCWLGLRNLHWILLILLGPGHFLQWLWQISISCIRCLGLERVTFECLLYINRLFCTCLEVRNSSLRLAEGHGTFWRYLQDYISG